MTSETSERILEVKGIKQYFYSKKGWFSPIQITRAVDDVSLYLNKCETLGILGESGCGKSTLLRSIVQLRKPTEGSVYFQGKDLAKLTSKELLPLRKDLQMVFQDPYSSLDPRMTVEEIISEPLWIYKKRKLLQISKREIESRVKFLINKVELLESYLTRYPHEFSGGQRQRVGIARALALNPRIILADEPVSALDVSIQGQILNLFRDLQKELGLSYIFVAHDLTVVKYISDRIIVMYLGSIVEVAGAEELYKNPIHPYTKALLAAIPVSDPKIARIKFQEHSCRKNDDVSLAIENSNYDFTYYYLNTKERVTRIRPPLQEVEPEHFVSCFLKKV